MQLLKRKIYIFVSHSHQDIEKVRVIRNYLEGLGGEPILFFLLSQTDEDKITTLIEQEIDARIWFLYCKSPNAELSTWVNTEISYARDAGKNNFLTIDLHEAVSDDLKLNIKYEKILSEYYEKMRRLSKLFIVYPRVLTKIIDEMVRILNSYQIALETVPYDENIVGIFDPTKKQIIESACILTAYTNRENYPLEVAKMANLYHKPIVFLRITGDKPDPGEAPADIRRYHYITFNVYEMEKSCDLLIKNLFDNL